MDPADLDSKARKEREKTDASLLAERTKTDAELAKTVTSVEEDADQVLEVARERAEELLRAARERADRDLRQGGAPPGIRTAVQVERTAQDGAVAEEREAAEVSLQIERLDHQRALSALLSHEREATDDGLLGERARADEEVATRDDFLAMVSHDLRSMLTGIALSSSVLAKPSPTAADGSDATIKHALRIQRLAARMNRLVGDLLDVVSLEAGKLHVTPGPVDANQLIKDAAEAFQPSFAAQDITLTTVVEPEALPAQCDQERINQVLANLLGNALKFTETRGEVRLSVARGDEEVHVAVTNTGAEIPRGQEEAIFERFRQVSPKDRRGLGLGLYIAKSIVDAHGGHIWAETPAAGGAAFHFTLPVAASP